MTRQTKHFVELSDIIAMRFECVHCHTTVSLPVGGEIRVEHLRVCPNCNEPWARLLEGSTIELSIKEFAESLRKFSGVLQRREEFTKGGGFKFSLELNPEVMPSDI